MALLWKINVLLEQLFENSIVSCRQYIFIKSIASEKERIIKTTLDFKNMQGWQRKDVYQLLNNKSNLVQTLSFAVYVVK